jgi:hypothetical protein
MVKVIAWSLYDLGDLYGVADTKRDPQTTYIRMVFTFSTQIEENVTTMVENAIKFGTLDEYTGFFTTDINIFPTDSIEKLKGCIGDELEALINANNDIPILKEYINWFIRNVYTQDSIYIDVPLDKEQIINDLDSKDGAPIKEMYENLKHTVSNMKYNILDKYQIYILTEEKILY